MKKFYQTVFCAFMFMFGSYSLAEPGGDRDIGDGTLPLSITAPMTLSVHEDAQAHTWVGHLAQDHVSLPLRQVIPLQDGQVTLLFGEPAHGVGLTGILAPENFTGSIFSQLNPSAALPVSIAR